MCSKLKTFSFRQDKIRAETGNTQKSTKKQQQHQQQQQHATTMRSKNMYYFQFDKVSHIVLLLSLSSSLCCYYTLVSVKYTPVDSSRISRTSSSIISNKNE